MVYTRLRHEFSITDAIRIVRKIEPLPQEVGYIVPYAIETALLLIRCLEALQRVSKVPTGLILQVGYESLSVLSQVVQVLLKVSADQVEALKERVKADLGI